MYTVVSLLVTLTVCYGATTVPALTATDAELVTVVNNMRTADANKAGSGQVSIDFGSRLSYNDNNDESPDKLFSKVDTSLFTKPTYAAFIKLFNNYNKDAGVKDPAVSVSEDTTETKAFLDAVEQTGPFKTLLAFLKSKNHPYGQSASALTSAISDLWFARYSRAKGVLDSSGFEHVFIGEVKNNEVSGLHNWVRIYELENEGQVNYKGYTVTRGTNLATIKFTWDGEDKPAGSVLIGTSPEFDLSTFTLCFLARRGSNKCKLNLDGCPFEVQSYDETQSGKIFVGTAYPMAAAPCKRT